MNTKEIIEGYMGNTVVNSIYQGSELIWPIYKYLIGGAFTSFNGSTQNKLIRLNMDESVDTSFNIGTGFGGSLGSPIYTLNLDNINQKVYVGGGFTEYNGSTQNYLIRLNMDGSKDTSFDIGTGFGGVGYSPIYALNLDNINQKLYVGGNFFNFNGNTQRKLIRLNMDGSLDTSFNIGTGFNDGEVRSIIIYNSKIYVGGSFTTFNGSTQNRLIRLNMDGSKDGNFNIGTGLNHTIYALHLDTINQKLYAGGIFTQYKDSYPKKLIRLNLDGSIDTSFDIGSGFDDDVLYINLDNINQKIYVGGYFDTFNGSTQNRLIRLNMDGTKDTSFDIGTGFDYGVKSVIIDNVNSKIYVGGDFFKFNGNAQKCIVRLNMDGSKDTSFDIGTGFDNNVYTILKYIE